MMRKWLRMKKVGVAAGSSATCGDGHGARRGSRFPFLWLRLGSCGVGMRVFLCCSWPDLLSFFFSLSPSNWFPGRTILCLLAGSAEVVVTTWVCDEGGGALEHR
ncbi:unnamed protein product [Lupinus luteus]|uniref:Secreted protein n=1 Tax=Lupinus luteus TaxID=3873 RepID=A0AAV1XQ78_LUPLU